MVERGAKGAPHILESLTLILLSSTPPVGRWMRIPIRRSLHLAPAFRTQRIPSNTYRSSALGRPPFLPSDFIGIWRLTFRHCSSVKYTTRSRPGLTSGETSIQK